MKWKLLIVFLSFTTTYASCQSATHQNIEEFKKINASLEQSSTSLNANDYSTIYAQIQAQREEYPTIALRADTVFYATSDALAFIDSLQKRLSLLDPNGDNLDIGTELINPSTASVLTNKLKAVYASCDFALLHKPKETEGDFEMIKDLLSNTNWSTKYFDSTPTIGVITILNKLKTDCTDLCVYTLKDLQQQLVD